MFRDLPGHPHQLHSNPECSQLTKHTFNIQSAARAGPPEDEQVMLETGRGS
jgi:hypothetical protein